MNNIPYVFNPMAISITIPVKDYSGVWVYVNNAGTGNTVASAMTMRNATIGSGQAGSGMKVLSGGVAERTSVTNLGKMYVSNGGTTNSATVISGGTMFVSSGGSGTSDRIFGGRAYVSNGGTLTDINVSGGAQVWIYNGGRINGGSAYTKDAASTGIASYTHIIVSNGGVVSGLHLYGSANNTSGTAFLYVYNGGTISNCINEGTTNSGGRMYISAGGKAYDCITSTYFGYVYGSGHRLVTRGAGQWNVFYGASMTDVFISGGVVSGHSGCIISGGTIKSGTMYVWGSATNILVPNNGAALQLRDKSTTGTTGNSIATGSATNLTLCPGASSFVSGGKLITATVQSGAILYVRPGISNTVAPANQGRAEEIQVSGGYVYNSGGTIASSYVQGFGTLVGQIQLHNGGIASECSAGFGPNANGTYNQYGYIGAFNGLGTNLTLNNGGVIQTYSATGKFESSTLNSGGIGNITAGGSASYILVNSNGVLRAFGSAGTTTGHIDHCSTSLTGGTIEIKSGGIATNIEAQKGKVLVSSAGIASNLNHYNPTATSATEQMIVYVGGTCNNIGQYGGGGGNVGLTIQSNTYISGLTASSYSGTAPYTTVYGTVENFNYISGWLYGYNKAIVSGGTATSALFRSNSGATFINLTVKNGTFEVNAGGKASNTILSQGGIMKVNSTGAIDGATVSSGGSMVLLKGGTVANYATIDIKSGGNVYISSGMTTNQLTGSGNIYVSTGAITTSTIVKNGGALNISSGGKASSTIVSNGGKMIVSSRGAIDEVTVLGGGSMVLLNGGTLSNFALWNINTGGNLIVSNTSISFDEDIIGQNITCINATISDTFIMAYASAVMRFNNTSIDTIEASDNGTFLFFSGVVCSYNNLTIDSASQAHFLNGVNCSNTAIVQNWAQMHVSSGAHIGNVVLHADGYLIVSSGGIADTINLDEDGSYLLVTNGGSALNVNSDYAGYGGTVVVENGGYITYAAAGGGGGENNYDGYCVIYVSNTGSGTIISSDTYMPDEMIGENCDGSGMVIYNNGDAYGTYIQNGGIMYIHSGGLAEFTEINSGGSMIVSSGGSASYTSVNNGGTLIVKSGGYADEVGEYGGTLICEPGGTLIPE